MERVIESIPSSLSGELSKKLIEIVLGTQDKNAVSSELAKKIIYLWRQDQLASPVGLSALFEAAVKVNPNATYHILDELGLEKVAITIKQFKTK